MVKILAWTKEAWKDYLYWQGQDKKTLKRINKLILDTQRTAFEGISMAAAEEFPVASIGSTAMTKRLSISEGTLK